MKCVAFLAASTATLIQFAKTDIKALQTLGAEIHMISPRTPSTASEEAIARFNETFPKLIWHDLSLCNSIYEKRQNKPAFTDLLQCLQEIKPDLLQCMGTVAGYYGRKAVLELPTQISCLYTPTDFQLYTKCGFFHRLFYTSYEKKYSGAITYVLPICQADVAYFRQYFPQMKQAELPLRRLDYEYYATPQKSAAFVRAELGIPDQATLLLYAGELCSQKRLRLVLQAMNRITEVENLHFCICGEGRDREFLENLTRRLHLEKQVHFLGYRTDMPDLLGAADIFCLPSRHETSCMAALEAMAAGLPLITAQVHGKWQYTDVQEIGAIFLKGDLVESCKDAIQKLSENKLLRKQMGAMNRAIAKTYTLDTEYLPAVRHLYRTQLEDHEAT